MAFHLSTDDLLPLVGLGLLLWEAPRPGLTKSTLWRVALAAVLVGTLARVASSVANTVGIGEAVAMLVEAIGRPAFLAATAVYVAGMRPEERRRRWVVVILASVGTFEAAFSLAALILPLPWDIAVQPVRLFESLGGCPGRLTGTLGLSPNHLGAVFVLTIPLTLGLAVDAYDRHRWTWTACAALQGAALALTFTRSSLLLAIVVTAALLLYHRRFMLLGVSFVASAAILVLVTSIACQAPNASAEPLPTQTPGEPGPAITDRLGDGNDRLALWYSGARIMFDYPWLGVGLGQSREVLAANPERYVDTPYGLATSSAHNTILLAGAETGVVGAMATLVLNVVLVLAGLIWIVRGRGPHVIASAAGFAIMAYLAQGMVNNLFTVPATSILLAVLVGAFATGQLVPPTSNGLVQPSTYTRQARAGRQEEQS